jgi:hypothetical protein
VGRHGRRSRRHQHGRHARQDAQPAPRPAGRGHRQRSEHPRRYFQIRGRATLDYEGAVEHIERLSQKYTGGPYPWYGGRDQVRVIVTVEPEHVSAFGGR